MLQYTEGDKENKRANDKLDYSIDFFYFRKFLFIYRNRYYSLRSFILKCYFTDRKVR